MCVGRKGRNGVALELLLSGQRRVQGGNRALGRMGLRGLGEGVRAAGLVPAEQGECPKRR